MRAAQTRSFAARSPRCYHCGGSKAPTQVNRGRARRRSRGLPTAAAAAC